jgi:hypothetical protein
MSTKENDLISRAELLQQAIATLQLMIQLSQAGGEIAPRLLRFPLPSTG